MSDAAFYSIPAHPALTGRRHAILSALPYLLLLAAAFSVFAESADDPFITFRYAANALAGHGPVFNIGERVEGFTSTLHLLVCMVLLKIAPSVGILFKAKLASLGFGLLALWQTRRLATEYGMTPGKAILAQLLVALNINFALACANGLETSLYVFLLLSTLLQFLRESKGRRGQFSALLLFLTLLARPETLLVFAGLLFLRVFGGKTRAEKKSDTLAWAAVFLAPALCFFCLRHWYFGQWLPNTYFAKSGPLVSSAKSGVEYLFETLFPNRMDLKAIQRGEAHPTQFLQIITAPVWWGLALLGLWRKRRSPLTAPLGVALLATLALALRSGGDWMIGWRFVAAIIPVAALLQVSGISALVEWRAEKKPAVAPALPPLIPAAAALLTLWTAAFAITPHNSWARAKFATDDGPLFACADDLGLTPITVCVGEFVKSDLPARSVIVYSEMGYGAFINADKTFIDFRGLTDGEISHLPSRYKSYIGVGVAPADLSRPQHPAYPILARRKPDYIICICQGKMPPALLGAYHHAATLTAAPEANGNRRQAYVYSRLPLADWRRKSGINPQNAAENNAPPSIKSAAQTPAIGYN